jgi:two-component system nitrogen regulation response regulator GlnG
MPAILVIDDDRSIVHLIRETFKGSEMAVWAAGTPEEGLALLKEHRPDVMLLDLVLPAMSGIETYEHIRQIDPKIPVIFITAEGSSETAIEATKIGAFDYLPKPLDRAVLLELVEQALKIHRLMQVPVKLPDTGYQDDHSDLLLGRSPQMLDVYKAIGRVAPQDVTVLIRGESGTGKELIARALYQHSNRARGPFLAVNCAAIPDTLLESELFGHEKGAFTSADRRRVGKFEQCTGGTIFLDEIGDMSILVQSKLLRLLQEQRFERVGGNETIETDVRIITATNRDLESMVAAGTFRGDLYYRLNGFTINLPPLRERGDDILLLLERFLSRFSRQFDRDVHGISPDALRLLTQYPWPGNVRELQSVLRAALLNSSGPVLMPEFLPDEVRFGLQPKAASGEAPLNELERFVDERIHANSTDLYAEALQMLERCVVTRVLRLTNGNQLKAAAMLGISRGSLRTKIRALGISIDQEVHIDGSEGNAAADELERAR